MNIMMNKKWIIVLLIVAYAAFFVSGIFSIQVHEDATNIKLLYENKIVADIDELDAQINNTLKKQASSGGVYIILMILLSYLTGAFMDLNIKNVLKGFLLNVLFGLGAFIVISPLLNSMFYSTTYMLNIVAATGIACTLFLIFMAVRYIKFYYKKLTSRYYNN